MAIACWWPSPARSSPAALSVLSPTGVHHHVLLHATSRGGFSRSSTHALPVVIGREASTGCAVPDFLDISAEHACLDFDPVVKSLTLRDLGSRNGTHRIAADGSRCLSGFAPESLGGKAVQFQLASTLTFNATLLEPPAGPSEDAVGRMDGPTVPYNERSRAQLDDALEKAVLSDVDTAADAYRRAVAGLQALLSPAGAIQALLTPERRDTFLHSIAVRHPGIFSAESIQTITGGWSPLSPRSPVPQTDRTLEPIETLAHRLDATLLPVTGAEQHQFAGRVASVLDLLLEHVLLTRHALLGTQDVSAAVRGLVASLRRHLFDVRVDDGTASRTVASLVIGRTWIRSRPRRVSWRCVWLRRRWMRVSDGGSTSTCSASRGAAFIERRMRW